MKVDILKKLIKQAVKEAIQEEMKDILLEAIKSPKGTGGYGQVTETVMHAQPKTDAAEIRSLYSNMIEGMGRGVTEMSFNSSHATPAYRPPATVNTTGEGSSLPQGEVSLDQILGLMSK